MAKLRLHLKGRFEFPDSADEGDGEAGGDAASDESELGSLSELSDRDDSPRGPAAAKISPRVVLNKPPRQSTPLSEEDEDVPCAPAKPSTGAGGYSRSTAKASGTSHHNGQPPPTAPDLGPVVQVGETPNRCLSSIASRPIPGRIQPPEPDDPDADEIVPATARQPSSPAESGSEGEETLSVCQRPTRMSPELDIAPKGKQVSGIGAKRAGSREDRQPHKKRRMEKMPKSADFASQEIRDIQSDISLRIEDEHRSFLAAQVRRDSKPVSPTLGAGIQGRAGGGQPRSLINTGGETPRSAATKRRPMPPSPSPARKARTGASSTTPPPKTGCNLTAKMGKSPLLSPHPPPLRPPPPPPSPPPPSVPQFPAGEAERRLTEPPKAGANASKWPLSIAKLKPLPKRPSAATKSLLEEEAEAKAIALVDSSSSDSGARGSPDVEAPHAPLQRSSGELRTDIMVGGGAGEERREKEWKQRRQREKKEKRTKKRRECREREKMERTEMEGEGRKGKEKEEQPLPSPPPPLPPPPPPPPPPPSGGLYAGFRSRTVKVPGYEDLSEGQLKELERRRRRYFGTHRAVEPFIATAARTREGDGEEGEAVTRAAPAAAAGQEGGSGWLSGDNDQWWKDEDTPVRQFVKKYKKLKSIRAEGT